jgi:hypothetical protein
MTGVTPRRRARRSAIVKIAMAAPYVAGSHGGNRISRPGYR